VSQKLPSNYQLAFNRELIAKRVSAVAASASQWALEHSSNGEQILCVCVLRGGALFFADLIREISTTVEIGFCRTWSYSVENHQVADGAMRVAVEDIAAHGRRVLLIDDICDSGKTLKKLSNVFLELGAIEVRTAILIHRLIPTSVFTPSWTAFEYNGSEWFVGYGMDDGGKFSNLPEVYSILAK
jgi:hypoxanthine phosphoribosyltransferase